MVWGGLNWSGASVTLRMLENHFLNGREGDERFLDFVVPKLASHFRRPYVKVRLSDFKMADDVQQQATDTNLMVQGFLSREGVLPEMGYDPAEEFNRLESEHDRLNIITLKDNLAAANMNSVVQALQAKAQVLLNYEVQLLQEQVASMGERKRIGDLTSFVQKLHEKGRTSPVEFDQSAMIMASMAPQYQGPIFTAWSQTMPLVSRLLGLRVNQIQQQQMQAQMAAAGGDPNAQGGAPGDQGAVEGDVPAGPGQVGSHPSADAGGGVDPGAAQPEQRPPQGQGSGI
jgi:hypothetical protein